MSLQQQISNLAVRVATECKAIRAVMGDKASLTTTDKSSLVAAINELKAAIGAAAGILDTASAGDTAHTYSADKILSLLSALETKIVAGAPEAYNTLIEISTKLASDDTALAALLTAVNARVAYDQSQVLTTAQQAQARTNIGAASAADVGDVTTDFVATFEASLS